MALKKSQLYSYRWQSCDELRGGMDASLPFQNRSKPMAGSQESRERRVPRANHANRTDCANEAVAYNRPFTV